jgi:hypothetical protein
MGRRVDSRCGRDLESVYPAEECAVSSTIPNSVVLTGYVDDPGGDTLRIRPNRDDERWLEIPTASVISIEGAENGLKRVEVEGEIMFEDIFDEDVVRSVEEALAGAPISTWNLIPEDRITAAGLLELVPYSE